MEKIVIVGDGETAELAYEYFTHDSPHEVVAFAVEREYRQKEELFGLPVVDFEGLEGRYPPAEFKAFVAVSYNQLNRVRARLFRETKRKGYACLSYVSSRAFVLEPIASIAFAGGPMNTTPAFSQAFANGAFSARKP